MRRLDVLSFVMSTPPRRTRALARAQLAGDEVEVRRLARAVGADDGRQRAGREGAEHMIHGDMAAEADRQVASFKHGESHYNFCLMPAARSGIVS